MKIAIDAWSRFPQLRVEPARAIHVGDSFKADVFGARRVGIDAVLIDRSGKDPARVREEHGDDEQPRPPGDGEDEVQLAHATSVMTVPARAPHRHDYHELVWVRCGHGEHIVDGAAVSATIVL